ncbi:rRNA-processing protein UTP23 homolog [Tribolium castaneum]|uniref:rRNA-processing protein UTP23 homolog n=1 Tax=Tribolium castaneum TaxID=7070 RepID=D7ELK6_TRICA|nr:PREDICTED: rRNA-processing protein UTP23 homolog isoform X4 [Tribolium castaneum]EFA12229.1 rRNA-processing protein UTP23 homolog-like Protein [Tribolium castaneum]|eukprot:XP_967790.1 PREDICTED: rRNA-processing protein UTP23 homolog isoform X4 [Tribolium castaneum]
MKIKRYKKVHKHLNFYINNFGFRQPYQILLDGTFCFAALNNKVNIADNVPRYLQGELKLLTTQCAIIEMENLGTKLGGALIILKKFPIHKCGHEGQPVVASECLLSMLGDTNLNHYVIATQDRDLQNNVRHKVGVPLLYLHGKTPVLEQPSEVTVEATRSRAEGLSVSERQKIEKLKLESGLVEAKGKKVKRKKKGPNPLSCKKKKKNKSGEVDKVVKNTEEKKKRKKIRIAQHVKEILFNKDNQV